MLSWDHRIVGVASDSFRWMSEGECVRTTRVLALHEAAKAWLRRVRLDGSAAGGRLTLGGHGVLKDCVELQIAPNGLLV